MARRGRLGAVALAVACGLTACSGGGGGSGGSGEPGAQPPEPSATATEEPDPTAIEPPPDGSLRIVTVAQGRESRRTQSVTNTGRAVVTAELVLVLAHTQELVAVDRESGELAWRTRLPRGELRRSGACPLVAPPPDATAVAVFSGLACGVVDRVSLEDGRILGSELIGDRSSPRSSGGVGVGDQTYWTADDAVHRVGPDGSSEQVAAPEAFDLRGEEYLAGITGIAGTDTLVAQVSRGVLTDSNRGRLVGMVVGEDGAAEVVWRRPLRPQLGPDAVPETAAVRDQMDGVVYSLEDRGVDTPVLSMIDPEDGSLDERRLVLPRNPPGRYPDWVEFKAEDVTTKVEPEGSVVSASGFGGFGYSPWVTRYDLETGEIAWTWRARNYDLPRSVSGEPIGRSVDGERYYVLTSGLGSDPRVVELDWETGRKLRTWQVPQRVDELMTSTHAVIAGDKLVLYQLFVDQYTRALAVVLEFG